MQKPATLSQIEIINKHLDNMLNFKSLSRDKREEVYYYNNGNRYINERKRVAIKLEIEKCKKWLLAEEENIAKNTVMQHREDELRLLLVKRFIYG